MEKFYFFRSFLDTARAIDDDKLRAEYLMAVAEYGLEGKESDDPMVKALMVQTQFVLDRSKELSQLKSECMKGNQNASKNWEKQGKQRKTEKNSDKQKKQEEEVEEEVEVEEEIENKKKEIDKEKDVCNKLHDPILGFDKFWNEYPVKRDKKKAMEKYNKLSPDKKKLAIEGISKLKKSEQRMKGFIPLPTTYLNGERWEDEVESRSYSEQLREQQILQHRQRIAEQIQSFKSESNQNETTGDQKGGYNRRENISFSDISG